MSYYQMHRGWMDSSVFRGKEYSKRDAWVWMIENARYKDTAKKYGTKNGDVKVARGQLSYSLSYLAKAWKWHISSVKRFLVLLTDREMIVIETETAQMRITICNYEQYQAPENEIETAPKQHRNSTESNKNKVNKVNNNNIYSEGFLAFWKAFPQRSGNNSKKNAFTKYKTALKRGYSEEDILSGSIKYFKYCEQEGNIGTQYVQGAAVWLNQEGWNNNYTTKKQTPKKNGGDFRVSTADQLNLNAESDAQRSLRELAQRNGNA